MNAKYSWKQMGINASLIVILITSSALTISPYCVKGLAKHIKILEYQMTTASVPGYVHEEPEFLPSLLDFLPTTSTTSGSTVPGSSVRADGSPASGSSL